MMSPTQQRVLSLHLHDAMPRSAMDHVREPTIVPPIGKIKRESRVGAFLALALFMLFLCVGLPVAWGG